MRVWFRLAIRELINRKTFSLFFILNMGLGLTGFIAVNSFKSSIMDYLENNLRNILTADAVIKSRVPFTEKEKQFINGYFDQSFEKSETREFFSMISTDKNSRLMQVVSIDENYPLYGSIILKKRGRITPELIKKELLNSNRLWLKPDALIMLDLNVGDQVKLGKSVFVIDDLIVEEPSVQVGTSGIASRVFVGKGSLKDSGLLATGTRTEYVIYLKSKEARDFKNLKKDFFEKIFAELGNEVDLRFNTYHDASERVGGLLSRMIGYLNLIAIIALFMAGVGAAYLFRDYFQSRLTEVGILLSLGANKKNSYTVIFIQILILGLAAALLTLILGAMLLPFMPMILDKVIPVKLEFGINGTTVLYTMLLSSLNSVAFCIPVMVRYRGFKPLQILRDREISIHTSGKDFLLFLSYLPTVLIFWGMAVWQSSLWEGTIFLIIFLSALLLIGLVALILIKIGEVLSTRSSVNLKIALRNISRHKLSTASCFTAIALGTFLVSIIPQIYQGIYKEIERPAGIDIPSLFMFDIQEDQIKDLERFIADQNAILRNVSPLIRARLLKVNDENVADFMKEKEVENSGDGPFSRTRRLFNISFRDKMIESEILLEGKTFEEYAPLKEKGVAMISMVERFAERYGFEIGDTLEFNVQGIPVKAKIVNFRRVKWNSFQPNFFIVMNSQELKDAPKVFLANVAESDQINKVDLQNQIVRKFPNVSVVNVSDALLRIIQIAEKMIFAITAMAYLSIFAGLTVIFSIARSESQNRRWEINMMKILGSRFNDLRKIVIFEFALTGIISACVGMILSIIFSLSVSYFLFYGIWAGSWMMNMFTLLSITAVIVFTTQLATSKVISQKPWRILRE